MDIQNIYHKNNPMTHSRNILHNVWLILKISILWYVYTRHKKLTYLQHIRHKKTTRWPTLTTHFKDLWHFEIFRYSSYYSPFGRLKKKNKKRCFFCGPDNALFSVLGTSGKYNHIFGEICGYLGKYAYSYQHCNFKYQNLQRKVCWEFHGLYQFFR